MKLMNTSLKLKEILVVKGTENIRALIFPSDVEAKQFYGDVEGMNIRGDTKFCIIANFEIPLVFCTILNLLSPLLTFCVELRKFKIVLRITL